MSWRNIKNSSYRAKKIEFNGYTFDSIYEKEVYCNLCQRFGTNNVEPHYLLELKPETTNFKELGWKVDFKVTYQGEVYYYEAKGLMTEDFRLKVQWLEWVNQDAFNRLFVVCRRGVKQKINSSLKLPKSRVLTKAEVLSHSPLIKRELTNGVD